MAGKYILLLTIFSLFQVLMGKSTELGYQSEIYEDESLIHTKVNIKSLDQSKLIKNLKNLQNLQNSHENLSFLSEIDNSDEYTSTQCDKRTNNYYSEVLGFFPALIGKLKNSEEVITFENSCFSHNEIKITEISREKSSITIELNSGEKKHYLCKHEYFLSTTNIFHLTYAFLRKTQKITFSNLTQNDFDEIQTNGIRIFEFCHGFIRTIFDFLKTKNMLLEGRAQGIDKIDFLHPIVIKEPSDKLNKEFLEEYGFVFHPRENKILHLNPSDIQDGDLFTKFALKEHSAIMFGTGGRVGHNAVAGRIDNELYIFEASGSIRKLKFEDWLKEKVADGNFVSYHPLSAESRAKFNITKALEFYNRLDGGPYGMRNVFFSWFDTANSSLHPSIPSEIFAVLFSLIEKFFPGSTQTMFNEALQMRLGITDRNMTIPEITAEAARRNLTFEELFAMPEKESYIYSNGENYVCSSLVIKFWKEGGLFGDLAIESHEFSPKDSYELKIFEEDPNKLPQICQDQNPGLPYCILSGKYTLDLINYNSIAPYDHMNENCPSVPPLYIRPNNC